MTVNQNPITLIYRIPINNVRKYNKAGLSFGSIISEANGYAYVAATTAYNNRYDIHNGTNGAALLQTITLNWVPTRLSDRKCLVAFGSRRTQKVKLIFNYLWKTSDLPVKFISARIRASARNYIQRAFTGNLEICQIQPGDWSAAGRYRGQLLKVAMESVTYSF
jgi:hypothetical protein